VHRYEQRRYVVDLITDPGQIPREIPFSGDDALMLAREYMDRVMGDPQGVVRIMLTRVNERGNVEMYVEEWWRRGRKWKRINLREGR
jgi:hypothetical protein